MWFLVAQPLLDFDLVSSQPQIPLQTQIHRHACTKPERTRSLLEPCWYTRPPVRQHQLRAPRPPAWSRACCRQPSNLDQAAHLQDLRHLLHDQHIMHCVFPTFPRHSSARPEPHRISVAGTAAGASAPAPGPLPSSRAKPLRNAVVKRGLHSSVLVISASSRARDPSECP